MHLDLRVPTLGAELLTPELIDEDGLHRMVMADPAANVAETLPRPPVRRSLCYSSQDIEQFHSARRLDSDPCLAAQRCCRS
jgi:hypothetical protein